MSPVPAGGTTPRPRPPPGGRRYRMTIAYDGTAYAGWQVQPGNLTVQEVLEARGTQGRIAKAIRTVVKAASAREEKKYIVEIV